jgi:gliding motility-associated-like protein
MPKFFIFLCCLFFPFHLLAQEGGIQTENNLGVEDLVENIFIKGNCRNVSNINAIGSEMLSIGQFNNGINNINITDGIILSTGDIELAQGPNIDNEAGFSFSLESNDTDLDLLATSTLFDVTGIEFDFVPIGNTVTFRYVFASEEYCEFVGTSFNDVFGFFVSGPGIEGTFDNNAINVASITSLNGTNESVSINNINHLNNETFYISNITTTDAQNCDIPYIPMFQDFVEYDGFTIPLIASFSVIPCETYHIRLVLGDVGDAILDSAVFLETNSFDLGEEVNVRAEVPGRDEPIAYENCIDGQFVFTRSSSSDINEDFTIEYNISSDSEAINGLDFVEIPMNVTIPAGQNSVVLPITVIEDNIIEGPESLKLELMYQCDCIDPALSELIINETNALEINLTDITVCANQSFNIIPEATGGVPPFDFLWETGEQTDTLTTSVSENSQYSVTLTDFCGNTDIATININIQDTPTASLMGTYDFCEIATTGIPILLGGNPPWDISYSIDGVEQTPIENIQISPFYLNPSSAGTYVLSSFNDAFCDGQVEGFVIIESKFEIEAEVTPPSCFNSNDGSIRINQLDAVDPFSISWNIETEDDYLLKNLSEGTYILSIEDGDSCLYEKIFDLSAISSDLNECAPVYIPNSFSPNEDGINDFFSIFLNADSEIRNVASLQIYNRWGALVFEQNNFVPNNGATDWKGEYKGKALDIGVYVYKVVLAFEDNSTLLISGDVSLLR